MAKEEDADRLFFFFWFMGSRCCKCSMLTSLPSIVCPPLSSLFRRGTTPCGNPPSAGDNEPKTCLGGAVATWSGNVVACVRGGEVATNTPGTTDLDRHHCR